MAKGGAATGKKRERFLVHKAEKKVRQSKKIENVQAHKAAAGAEAGEAAAPAAAAPAADLAFARCRPFLEAAPLATLRFFAEAPATQSRPPPAGEAAAAADDDDAAAAASAARRERRELMSQLKKRVPRSGAAPRRVADWVLSSGEAWAPAEDPDRALAYTWAVAGGRGACALALPDREAAWADGAAEAVTAVERAATSAGPALRLRTDEGSTLDLVLETDVHGAIRVRGTARRAGDDRAAPVVSAPLDGSCG